MNRLGPRTRPTRITRSKKWRRLIIPAVWQWGFKPAKRWGCAKRLFLSSLATTREGQVVVAAPVLEAPAVEVLEVEGKVAAPVLVRPVRQGIPKTRIQIV